MCIERLGSDVCIYVMLKLGVSGVIPLLSVYAFMAWSRTILYFYNSIGSPTGRSNLVVSTALLNL
jgi:hypothetical protein